MIDKYRIKPGINLLYVPSGESVSQVVTAANAIADANNTFVILHATDAIHDETVGQYASKYVTVISCDKLQGLATQDNNIYFSNGTNINDSLIEAESNLSKKLLGYKSIVFYPLTEDDIHPGDYVTVTYGSTTKTFEFVEFGEDPTIPNAVGVGIQGNTHASIFQLAYVISSNISGVNIYKDYGISVSSGYFTISVNEGASFIYTSHEGFVGENGWEDETATVIVAPGTYEQDINFALGPRTSVISFGKVYIKGNVFTNKYTTTENIYVKSGYNINFIQINSDYDLASYKPQSVKCDGLSVSRAIDLANVFAGENNRVSVIVSEKSVWDVRYPNVNKYVDVIHNYAYGNTSDGNSYEVREKIPRDNWFINFPGALIAIRIDSTSASWLINSSTFAIGGVNQHPVYYAWYNGVPLTFAITPSRLNTSDNFTDTHIKALLNNFGCEVAVTSLSGNNSYPTNYNDLFNEIVTPKYAIENKLLADPMLKPNDIYGVSIRGYVQPDWTFNSSNLAEMRTQYDKDKAIAKLLRENYQWAECALYPNWSVGAMPKFGATAVALDTSNALNTLNDAKAFLETIAFPNTRHVFSFSNVSSNATKFKNLIDAIVALRDDRTAYPYRALMPVTCSMLHLGKSAPAYYDSNGLIMPKLGIYESFNNPYWTVGNLTLPYTLSFGVIRSYGTGFSASIATESNIKHLRLSANSSNTSEYIYFDINMCNVPGRSYCIKFTAKAVGNDVVSVRIYPQYRTVSGNSVSTVTDYTYQTTALNYFIDTTAWKQYSFIYRMPTWATGGIVRFVILGKAGGETRELLIRDIEIFPI